MPGKHEQRIRRAEELARLYPFASDILTLYGELAAVQRGVYEQLRSDDIADLLPHFPALLLVVGRVGPPDLAESARSMAGQEARWAEMLGSYWSVRGREIDACELFLTRAILQPFAEDLADRSDVRSEVVR